MILIIIILIVIVSCSFCILISTTLSAQYSYKYYNTASPWKCIDISNNKNNIKNIISRINKGESECMYNKGGLGCMIIHQYNSDDEEKEKEKEKICSNYIDNYPTVKLEDSGDIINLDIYTCGKNSTHMKKWNVSGYDSPRDHCSIIQIKNKRSFREIMGV